MWVEGSKYKNSMERKRRQRMVRVNMMEELGR